MRVASNLDRLEPQGQREGKLLIPRGILEDCQLLDPLKLREQGLDLGPELGRCPEGGKEERGCCVYSSNHL